MSKNITAISARELARKTGEPINEILEHVNALQLGTVGKTSIITPSDTVQILNRMILKKTVQNAALDDKRLEHLITIRRLASLGSPQLRMAADAAIAEHRDSVSYAHPTNAAKPHAAALRAEVDRTCKSKGF